LRTLRPVLHGVLKTPALFTGGFFSLGSRPLGCHTRAFSSDIGEVLEPSFYTTRAK
jgi:hypothetical protein